MGNRVLQTCIISTVPHGHVHHVVTSMCIASTFKIIAPQNNELSTPQIHKLSRGVSKMVPKFPPQSISVQEIEGPLSLDFPFPHRNLVG
jgi:hypothetical protein